MVELAPFQIGKFPVTNAEWVLFMEAGGYEDERWWDTEAAKAWRRGEGTAEGAKQQWRETRQWIQDHLDSLHEYEQFTAEGIKEYIKYAQMSDEEFETQLRMVSGRSADSALFSGRMTLSTTRHSRWLASAGTRHKPIAPGSAPKRGDCPIADRSRMGSGGAGQCWSPLFLWR